jgi:hypothetical protein
MISRSRLVYTKINLELNPKFYSLAFNLDIYVKMGRMNEGTLINSL